MRRGIAIILKNNEKGFDLAIPVLMKDVDGVAVVKFTAILLQIRNYNYFDGKASSAYVDQSMSCAFGQKPLVPYLSLYCQFGDSNGTDALCLKQELIKTRGGGSTLAKRGGKPNDCGIVRIM